MHMHTLFCRLIFPKSMVVIEAKLWVVLDAVCKGRKIPIKITFANTFDSDSLSNPNH